MRQTKRCNEKSQELQNKYGQPFDGLISGRVNLESFAIILSADSSKMRLNSLIIISSFAFRPCARDTDFSSPSSMFPLLIWSANLECMTAHAVGGIARQSPIKETGARSFAASLSP